MTHEQFITELATANQAFADCQEEIKALFKGVNSDNAPMIATSANTLRNAAKILTMAADNIAKHIQVMK